MSNTAKNKNGEENEEQEEGVGERSLFRVYLEIVDRIIPMCIWDYKKHCIDS